MAQKLVNKSDIVTDSPAGARPGGAPNAEADLIKRFQEAESSGQKAMVLEEIKSKYPKTFDRLIADKSIEEKGFLKNLIIETGKFAGNPVTYGIGKMYNLYKLATRPQAVGN